MTAEETLAQIATEVSVCTACTLNQTRKRSVPGEGPANSEIMLIGEGPGFNENEQGRPFVGAAGRFLEELLAQAGLKRTDVWIGNVVKCRPPNNRDPQQDELAACDVYLERQISAINPKIIITPRSIPISSATNNGPGVGGTREWAMTPPAMTTIR